MKFIYFEKATKFCEISTVDLTITISDKSTVEISQKFIAFSEWTLKRKDNSFIEHLNLLKCLQGKLYLPLIEIKELNIAFTNISEDCIDNLATKLTRNIEKLNLQELKSITDRHINTLVLRCKKISVLDLKSTSITDDSLTSIIENLQSTLEELNVGNTYVRNSARIITNGSLPNLISFNNWSFS